MISIITPTYNRANLLPRMINSVLAQTFLEWELNIVDDGSTDNTRQLIEKFKDDRIKYHYTENSGAADSRNKGVELAQYDNIIFLDSDDEVVSDWLEHFVEEIRLNSAEVISCGFEKYNSKGVCIQTILPKNLGMMFNNIKANFLAGTILYNKRYFVMSGGYDVNLRSGQHTELFLRLIKFIQEDNLIITTIDKPLVKVYLHDGLRIRHNSEALFQGSTQFIKKHNQLLIENPDKFIDYLSVAGVAAVRTKRYKEANSLFFQALKINKRIIKSYVRLIISVIPVLRDKFWQNNNHN